MLLVGFFGLSSNWIWAQENSEAAIPAQPLRGASLMALKPVDQRYLSDLSSICNTLAAGKQPFSGHCLYKLLSINVWLQELHPFLSALVWTFPFRNCSLDGSLWAEWAVSRAVNKIFTGVNVYANFYSSGSSRAAIYKIFLGFKCVYSLGRAWAVIYFLGSILEWFQNEGWSLVSVCFLHSEKKAEHFMWRDG